MKVCLVWMENQENAVSTEPQVLLVKRETRDHLDFMEHLEKKETGVKLVCLDYQVSV